MTARLNFIKKLSWVGKYRKTNSCNGGIGMCMESNITVLDDNLLNSKDDTLERCGCSCD
jgi:hypothetical protein